MADEEFQIAQARPNLYDKVPGAAPLPPPGPMNKTPNALPPAASKPGLFDDIPKKERHQMSDDEKRHAVEARKNTLLGDRSGLDDVANKMELAPKSPDEWKAWARSLNIKNYEYATELDKWLQGRGFTGIMDPKLGPKEKKAVNDLLDKTLAHWYRSTKGKNKGGGGDDKPVNDPKSDEFKSPYVKPQSELRDVPSAVSALGGRMMEEEDAA